MHTIRNSRIRKVRAARQVRQGTACFCVRSTAAAAERTGGALYICPPPNGVESEFAARTAVGHNMPRAAHVWLGCVCNTSAVAGRTAQEAVSEFAARTAVGYDMPRAAHVWLSCGAQLLRQDLFPRTRCTPHYIGCVCDTSAVAGHTAQEAVSEFAVPRAAGVLHVSRLLRDITYGNAQFVRIC